MSAPIVTSISPTTGAISGGVKVNIIGSGFFAGTSGFNVSSVTIGGVKAHINPSGTDTNFSILAPVVRDLGSYNLVVNTSSGASTGTPFLYTMFPEGQDRSIDYKTAQFWCYGCPFLAIQSHARNPQGANPVSFDSVEPRYANPTKTHYYCTSPNVNFKQRISQEISYIGVGWCPFAEQKWQTLYNVAESF